MESLCDKPDSLLTLARNRLFCMNTSLARAIATLPHVETSFRHQVTLEAATPFDFAHSLGFLCSFPPTAGEQIVDRRALTKATSIDGRAVLWSVREIAGELRLTVTAPRMLDGRALDRVVERVRFQLSLDDDLTPFVASAEADERFAPVERRWHGHHHVKFPTPFEIAIWAVLAQRNQALGRRIKDAIVRALGPRIVVDGIEHRAFPEPEAMLDAARVRAVVGDAPKADAMVTIARTFRDHDVAQTLRSGSYDEALSFLLDLPRIGPWSAAFILFRGLGRMERLAENSGPIFAAARSVYGQRSESELRAIAESYGEWCGYWALYLRRS